MKREKRRQKNGANEGVLVLVKHMLLTCFNYAKLL